MTNKENLDYVLETPDDHLDTSKVYIEHTEIISKGKPICEYCRIEITSEGEIIERELSKYNFHDKCYPRYLHHE
jgi:hypothetical protein